MEQRIRVMSHNVWNRDVNSPDWEKIGKDCSADARISGLLQTWRDLRPDVIGCQEVSKYIFQLLTAAATGEDMGYEAIPGCYTPLFYRKERFEKLESVFFPYPETIEGLEGSFNDVGSKSCHAVVLLDKQSGKKLVFAGTHLWWKSADPNVSIPLWYQAGSDEARAYQAGLLANTVEELAARHGCPAVIVGDLNTGYESAAVGSLFARGFRHAHDVATEYVDETVGYHNCFPWGYEEEYWDKPFKTAIDHILVKDFAEGAVKRFERYSPAYYLPISDHSPVFADIEL